MGPIWWTLGLILFGGNAAMVWVCLAHADKHPVLYATAVVHVLWCAFIAWTMKRELA